jgi:hypothetical protein
LPGRLLKYKVNARRFPFIKIAFNVCVNYNLSWLVYKGLLFIGTRLSQIETFHLCTASFPNFIVERKRKKVCGGRAAPPQTFFRIVLPSPIRGGAGGRADNLYFEMVLFIGTWKKFSFLDLLAELQGHFHCSTPKGCPPVSSTGHPLLRVHPL